MTDATDPLRPNISVDWDVVADEDLTNLEMAVDLEEALGTAGFGVGAEPPTATAETEPFDRAASTMEELMWLASAEEELPFPEDLLAQYAQASEQQDCGAELEEEEDDEFVGFHREVSRRVG
jgi:hypothetical protein